MTTSDGPAIVKYLGNPAGEEALICELVGTEIANLLSLRTPDFAISDITSMEIPSDPPANVREGPAFFSRWEEATALSPNSSLLLKVRNKADIAKVVVFDTWIRNPDRFVSLADRCGAGETANFDNLLFRGDKRMAEVLVIDHTHAFVETTLEDELDNDWINEQYVYGLEGQRVPYNTVRPHSALGYRPPAPGSIVPLDQRPTMH